MSTKRLTVSSFALSALVAIQSAGAQERNPGQIIPSNGQPQVSDQQISATQNREGISGQAQAGQTQAGQVGRTNQQPGLPGAGPIVDGRGQLSGQATTTTQNGNTTLQGGDQQGTYEARRTPTEGTHASMNVQQVVLHKLMRGNQAEIELAQIAQQEAKHDKVKQFAQMMIKDHQQALQELQRQQQSTQGDHGANASHPNASGVADTASGQPAAGNPGVAGQATTGQPNTQNPSQHAAMQQERVPQQLVQLMDRTCTNSLEQSKEMLQQHRDKDFDMAYIGQQIVMHSMMLAELKALESDGPKQLQPIVQNAKRTTESHMKEAKQIAEQLASNHSDHEKDDSDDN